MVAGVLMAFPVATPINIHLLLKLTFVSFKQIKSVRLIVDVYTWFPATLGVPASPSPQLNAGGPVN
jgi:hypothetical protein